MRNIAYLLTSFSCVLLSMQLYGKNNKLFALLIFGVGMFYLWKLFYRRGRKNGVHHEHTSAASNPCEKKDAVRKELEEILAHCRRNRNITRNASISLALIATVVLFVNTPLGIALYIFVVPLGVLFYKNQKAVNMIEQGM